MMLIIENPDTCTFSLLFSIIEKKDVGRCECFGLVFKSEGRCKGQLCALNAAHILAVSLCDIDILMYIFRIFYVRPRLSQPCKFENA